MLSSFLYLTFFIFLHFILIKFYWSIAALQCHVGFYCTATWISHTYTYLPSWTCSPSRPLRGTEQSSLCCALRPHQHKQSVRVGPSLPVPPTLLFPPWCPYIYSLLLCLYFCFANNIISATFSRFHIHALMYDICSSLSDSLHSVWTFNSS